MKKIFLLFFIFLIISCNSVNNIKQQSKKKFLPPHQYNQYELHQKYANTLAFKTVNSKVIRFKKFENFHKLIKSDFEKLKITFLSQKKSFNKKEQIKFYYKRIYYAIELEKWDEAKEYYIAINKISAINIEQRKKYDFGVEFKIDDTINMLQNFIQNSNRIKKALSFKKFFIENRVSKSNYSILAKYYRDLYKLSLLEGDTKQALVYIDKAIKNNEKIVYDKKWIYGEILMDKFRKAEIYNKRYEILKKQKLFAPLHLNTFSDKKVLNYYKDLNKYLDELKSEFKYNAIYLLLNKRYKKILNYYKGNIFLYKQNYKRAIKSYEDSLEIGGFLSPQKDRLLSDIKISLAIAYSNTKQYQKAFVLYDLALEDKEMSNEIYNYSAIKKYLTYENYEASKIKGRFRSNSNFFEEQYGKEFISLAELNMFIAQSYYKIKKFNKAYFHATKAYEIFLKNKFSTFSILENSNNLGYITQRKMFASLLFYYTPINDRYAIEETFNKFLNFKRTIYNNESSLMVLGEKTKDKRIKNKINKLFELKKSLAQQNQQIIDIRKIYSTRNKIREITTFLSLSLPKFKKKLNPKNINYKDISTLLNPNELYIDFVKAREKYYYFTLDKNQNITFKKLTKQKSKIIDKLILDIRETILSIPTKDDKSGQYSQYIKYINRSYIKLYDLIFKNINLKNKTSLIISPDGLLGLIPFEAFYDKKEQKYLIEKLKIRYTPSGKEFVKLHNNNSKTKSNDIVVFADVNFDSKNFKSQKIKGSIFNSLSDNNSHLEYSKKDAMVVKKLFPNNTKLFLGKNATEENLFKVNAPKILYLSTHGFFLKNKEILNPMLKSIILLDGANDSIRQKKGNGIVSGLELAGLNLRGTELVVLSACETGVGEIDDGEGVAGMSKAFMRAGAKNVIMTLWSVNDEKSALLMEKFYEEVKRGLDYNNALREAKLFMIRDKETELPFYWSGFILN